MLVYIVSSNKLKGTVNKLSLIREIIPWFIYF